MKIYLAIAFICSLAFNVYQDIQIQELQNQPIPEISATSTSAGLRDQETFVLRPNMVDEYEDWIKYVDIMEGDTIHITVFEPVYPDPGNDQSNN